MTFKTWRLRDEPPSRAYDLLTNLIVPRPIAFVSSVSAKGAPNLAPFSFFMLGGVNPPSLAFCPVLGKDGRKKASLLNVEETGEFVVNLVTRSMAEDMNTTGVDYPEGFEKWGLSGFTPTASVLVGPARVSESPVHFECKVHEIVHHGSSHYVIGEVLVAHVAEDLAEVEDGFGGFQPIARIGGARYVDLHGGKVFELPRPSPGAQPS